MSSLKGHALDLKVTIGFNVFDSLHVEMVRELEFVSIWQLDGQVSLVKGDAHLHNAPRLEEEGRLLMLGPPGSAILAIAHSGVGIPMGIEARVEV
jgi:hypothetical protein